MSAGKNANIALVCDWLDTIGGAERVLLALHELYPSAPIYTSHYDEKGIDWFKNATIKTGWLQIFPTRLRRLLSPLRARYFSHLDLTAYDLVISVTGAEAKAVKAKNHICYCHAPTQYYWHLYDDYMKNPGFGLLNPIVRFGLKILIKPLRKKDYAAAQRPTKIITISSYSKDLIKQYYDRESTVIFPPVDLKNFSTSIHNKKGNCQVEKPEQTHTEIKSEKSQIKNKTRNSQKCQIENTTIKCGKSQTCVPLRCITTSRQVTWKRLDLCIEACKKTGDRLTIIGDGPEHINLVKLAKNCSNIVFLPTMSQAELATYLKTSDVYLFPSLEPFGIAPVEALSAGCPVIAYGAGGALDYIEPGKNGLFFKKQDVNSLVRAIEKFRKSSTIFSRSEIAISAIPFDVKNFKIAMKNLCSATTNSVNPKNATIKSTKSKAATTNSAEPKTKNRKSKKAQTTNRKEAKK